MPYCIIYDGPTSLLILVWVQTDVFNLFFFLELKIYSKNESECANEVRADCS